MVELRGGARRNTRECGVRHSPFGKSRTGRVRFFGERSARGPAARETLEIGPRGAGCATPAARESAFQCPHRSLTNLFERVRWDKRELARILRSPFRRVVIGAARESHRPELAMLKTALRRTAKVRYGLAALILGLPLPIVLIAFLVGGCR